MEDVLVAAVLADDGTGVVHLQAGPHLFSIDPAGAAILGRLIAHAAAIARRLEMQKGADPGEAPRPAPPPAAARREASRLPGRARSRRRNVAGARRLGRRT